MLGRPSGLLDWISAWLNQPETKNMLIKQETEVVGEIWGPDRMCILQCYVVKNNNYSYRVVKGGFQGEGVP